MSVKKVAFRYAKSLLELSVELNSLERVKEDMDALQVVIKESKEFAAFIKSPVIQFSRKRSLLEKLFTGKLDELTLKFITLLAGKQREAILGDIIVEFLDQYRRLKQTSVVKITTAIPIQDVELDRLRKKIVASDVGFATLEVETAVDADLIGGYVVEIDGHLYDASIRKQIHNLKKEFRDNLYESKITAR